jgi:hypothetical protein
MRIGHYFLFLNSCLCFTALGFAEKEISDKDLIVIGPDIDFLTRADSLPVDDMNEVSDSYLEGYIQALIDIHFYEQQVIVKVEDHKVYLSNLPHNDLLASSILNFVKEIPGVKSVEVVEASTPEERAAKGRYFEKPAVSGIWFPQATVLYPPMVADPREVVYSVAYRAGDKVIGQTVAAVSLGDEFPIFRWRDILHWHGDMQIGIQAGIWAVFNYSNLPHSDSGDFSELVNTDYLVGIPLSYAFDRWAFRLRIYHISSHLGDEFLVNNPEWLGKRKNPSFEAIDFFTSYQFSKNLRGYFGPGVIVHSDNTFPMKYFYIEYGFELRLFGKKMYYHKLYGTPFLAVHLENWQVRHWNLDSTFKIGYEWSKMQGIGRKVRLYGDYHQGYSYEGQFFKKRVKYGEIGFAWGF